MDTEEPLPAMMRPFVVHRPKEFHHVLAFCQAGPFSLMVEPNMQCIQQTVKYDEVEPLSQFPASFIAQWFAERGIRVVKHEFKPRLLGCKLFSYAFPSCVTAIKMITGYYSAAITPYQLYKSLLNDGGVELAIQTDDKVVK